jgi:hypothetical protein
MPIDPANFARCKSCEVIVQTAHVIGAGISRAKGHALGKAMGSSASVAEKSDFSSSLALFNAGRICIAGA